MDKSPQTHFLSRVYIFISFLFLVGCLLYFLISSSMEKNSPKVRGKIFNQRISSQQFEKAKQTQMIQLQMQFGELYVTFLDLIDVEQETWNTLTLLYEAKRRGIKVSNDDVIKEISQFPVFFRKNKFDTQIYRSILRQKFNTTPDIFEENVRNSLIIQKLNNEITSNIKIDQDKTIQEHIMDQHKIQLSYVEILSKEDPKAIESSITPQQIDAYFQNHPEDFLLPPAIKIEYIKLLFPEDGGVQKEVEMKFKAKAIVEEYNKGEAFKTLGTKYKSTLVTTDYVSKSNFPELGLNRSDIAEAFLLRKNAISSPLELKDGYLVYRIVDKKDSRRGSLDETKNDIIKILVKERLDESLKNQSLAIKNQIDDKLKNNPNQKSFTDILKEMKLDVKQTTLQSIKDNFYELNLDDKDLAQFRQLNLTNRLSQPLFSPDAALILYVDQYETVKTDIDNQTKEKVVDAALGEEKNKVWNEFLDKLLKSSHLEITYP